MPCSWQDMGLGPLRYQTKYSLIINLLHNFVDDVRKPLDILLDQNNIMNP